MKELIITADNAGGRLDKLLGRYLDKAPKGFVYKMLRKKNIELNGKKAAGNEILKEGDRISFFLADDTIAKFRSADSVSGSEDLPDRQSLEKALLSEINRCTEGSFHSFFEAAKSLIVYEDETLIAFNKPAGMLSQKAGPDDLSLNDILVCYMNDGSASEIPFTPGISNRLDRNTSGLVLAGKTPAAARELNLAIKERKITKRYLCLVKGMLKEEGSLDGYLVKDEKSNSVSVYTDLPQENAENKAERIITAYRPRKVFPEMTLLEVDLITGKSHQIRAHLSSIGHPVIGDPKYGDPEINQAFRKEYGVQRQLLHAFQVIFQDLQINAPLPEDFQRIPGITEI